MLARSIVRSASASSARSYISVEYSTSSSSWSLSSWISSSISAMYDEILSTTAWRCVSPVNLQHSNHLLIDAAQCSQLRRDWSPGLMWLLGQALT